MAGPPRPLIGINADFTPADRRAQPHLHRVTAYLDAIQASGGLPVVLPPLHSQPDPAPSLDRLDGLVLIGGAELPLRGRGRPPHPASEGDRRLLLRALNLRMPLLAIGVGMQQLAVATGGRLHLRLSGDQPRSLAHRDPTSATSRHTVLIEPGTRLEEICGAGAVRVPSDHHQAVRRVGPGFRVAARAPDGVIEAIETLDPHWFCIGVQWHPELPHPSAHGGPLFESLVQTCSTGPLVRLAA